MRGFGNDNRPILERFDQYYELWYDSRRRIQRLKRKSNSGRTADLLDTVDMIDVLMTVHQSIFEIDQNYAWSLYFPHLFVKPEVGDKIINKTTDELYEIIWVEEIEPNETRRYKSPIARNDKRGAVFTGRVLLKEGVKAPTAWDELEFFDHDKNYINFFEWSSKKHTSSQVTTISDALDQQKGPFTPSVTWHVKRVEPGSIGRHPFDPQKEVKPRLREQFPDPERTYLIPSESSQNIAIARSQGYTTGQPIITGAASYQSLASYQQSPLTSTHTISVYGQWFDNIIQYDCWSIDNQEANALVAWFEDFMDLYTPVLKRNGVAEVLYWQRSQDTQVDKWRADIDNRTVQYFFRTEKLRVERSKNLRQINTRVTVALEGTPYLIGEPTGIASYAGVYGKATDEFRYDTGTGVFYTGSGNYQWGDLTIQQ